MVLLLSLLTKCVVAFAPSRTPTTPFFTTRLSPSSPAPKAAILPTADPCTSTTLFAYSPVKKNPNLSIEYCTGCRWMFRASWLMQECLTTFNDEIGSITLIPSKPPSPGGTFLIKLNNDVIWDRRLEGAFPEAKQLKQRIRDKISPQKDLGHSDIVKNEVLTDPTSLSSSSKSELDGHCKECDDAEKSTLLSTTENEDIVSDKEDDSSTESRNSLNNINITYCTGKEWMMRATWMGQELLSTFQEELYSITITPSRPPEVGGQYVSIQSS